MVIDGTNQSSKFRTSETGTYKVNSDRTGTARINYKSGEWIDLELVVVNQGESASHGGRGRQRRQARPALDS